MLNLFGHVQTVLMLGIFLYFYLAINILLSATISGMSHTSVEIIDYETYAMHVCCF